MKKTKPKIYYDKETDVLWLMVKNGPEDHNKEIAPGISIELDKNGELIGIEILNASKVLGPKLGFKPKSTPYASYSHKINIPKR